jgi:hypothetical protein
MNPLIPTFVDVVMMVTLIIALGLSFAAFISMIRAATLSGWRFLVWALVVFLLPIAGAAAWFATRRRDTGETFARRGAAG